MIDFELKPYQGEDEESFTKRKAYLIRILKRRMNVGLTKLPQKLVNAKQISAQEKEEIDAFWSRYLSSEMRELLVNYKYYDFYNNFLAPGEQLCHYLPDSFYQAFIDEYYTNPQHSDPCDDKNLYDIYFHDVNRPFTVFRKTHGLIMDRYYNEISIKDAIALCREEKEVVLKKGKFSMAGEGIMFWAVQQSEERLLSFIDESQDVVCQRIIKQHSELNRLNKTSVNTLRLLTFVFKGKVHLLSSILRMGINGARVDNACQGGIVCGIKPSGQLKNVAFDTLGNIYEKHPQGTAFESVTIPNYKDCIELVITLSRRFVSVSRLISWDIAIDEKGKPLLIEFNLSFGEMDFHQICNGPIFGGMTEGVLTDVFNNSYTLNSIIKSFQS